MIKIVQGLDSSLSLYNEQYMQSYHSKSLGAYTETLLKHIFPAQIFFYHFLKEESIDFNTYFLQNLSSFDSYLTNQVIRDNKFSSYKFENFMLLNNHENRFPYERLYRPIRILDICFGLGYNAMFALQAFSKCEIYSPEQDLLFCDLQNFDYCGIHNAHEILSLLEKTGNYQNFYQSLYFLHGNALDIVKTFPPNFFDIVFQDAFSQNVNQELWSKEYFNILFRITAKPCIITTYAKAKNILEVANKVGFSAFKYKYGSILTKSN